MNDKISIIIPAYNVKNFIERTLESICNQTYKNIEIIVVNDGSTDGTYSLLNKIATRDHRIKVIHKENGGVTSARVIGIKASSGKWIGFVDGDDYIEPNMYEKLLDNALKYNAEISHCGFQMRFHDGRIKYFHNTGRRVSQPRDSALISLLKGDFIEPGLWNKLYDKKLFVPIIENDTMDYTIKNNEDLLMNYLLFSNATTLIYEDFCPYHYQIREITASRGKLNPNKIYDPIKVKKIVYNISSEQLKPHALRAYISTCILQYNWLIFDKSYKNDLKQIRTLIKEQKRNFHILSKKKKLSAQLILYSPFLYDLVYFIYTKIFQTHKYS